MEKKRAKFKKRVIRLNDNKKIIFNRQ